MGTRVTEEGSAWGAGGPPRRIGIVVLGMHRSGTSAVTRVLSLLGASLPQRILPAGRGNETGHWESERLLALHDAMLREAGSRWDDWRSFDATALPPGRLEHYREGISGMLEEEFGDASLLVLKDPRIARLVPLYEEIFTASGLEARYVCVLRNPLSVAASLKARDEMTEGFVDLVWLRHVLDAERATRGRPRAFVSYEAILEDWRSEFDRISEELDIAWPQPPDSADFEIRAHVSSTHQHHKAELSDLQADPRIVAWVREAYPALLYLATNPAAESPLIALDRIRAEFEVSASVVGESMFAELAHRESRLKRVHAEAIAAASERAAELERSETVRRDLERELERLTAQVAEREKEVQGLESTLAERREQIERLHEESVRTNAELSVVSKHLDQVLASRSWRMTAPFRQIVRRLVKAPRE